MSGHSKWATIKHKKAALDSKRGKVFTRIIKEISIAARSGGDPDANPRLRTAVTAAKAVSMPADNIKRAIMRGTGELGGAIIEEVRFEGYGPGGAALLVDCVTDNRNRTVSEINKIFDRSGGKMGSAGCAAYLFERKGVFSIDLNATDEDTLMGIALEAGADDLKRAGTTFEVTCDPAVFNPIKAAALAQIDAARGLLLAAPIAATTTAAVDRLFRNSAGGATLRRSA